MKLLNIWQFHEYTLTKIKILWGSFGSCVECKFCSYKIQFIFLILEKKGHFKDVSNKNIVLFHGHMLPKIKIQWSEIKLEMNS